MKKKHILVIGASKGIGQVIAKQLIKGGNLVSVVARTKPTDSKRRGIQSNSFCTDITNKINLSQTISSIVKKNGKISSLVFSQRLKDAKDDWQGELDLTLSATKNIIELVLDHLDGNTDHAIVIINSVAHSSVLPSQSLGYHVAKAGLLQLVRYLAVTLGPKGVRINSISPATVMKDEAKAFYMKEKTLMALFADVIPLGRMGTPLDIANLVEFLCSTKSSYITGQNITIDGGYYLLSPESLTRKYGKK